MFKTIESSEGLRNTPSGGRRYRVKFTDGSSFGSKPDAQWVSMFGNAGLQPGDTVDIYLDDGDRISHMYPVTVVTAELDRSEDTSGPRVSNSADHVS